MIPDHEKVYEEELRSLIRAYREEEEYNRTKRQNLEAKFWTREAQHGQSLGARQTSPTAASWRTAPGAPSTTTAYATSPFSRR